MMFDKFKKMNTNYPLSERGVGVCQLKYYSFFWIFPTLLTDTKYSSTINLLIQNI